MSIGDLGPVRAALRERFPTTDFQAAPLMRRAGGPAEQVCLSVAPRMLRDVMVFLRDDERCRFDQLSDLTCVDFLKFPGAEDRYGVTYSLLSTSSGRRLWVRCFVNDPEPRVRSVTSVWPGAEWLEREVWDLFGVRFDGHPDLRRIMTWEGFEAHPLRKDYPLRGRGERERYPVVTRESV